MKNWRTDPIIAGQQQRINGQASGLLGVLLEADAEGIPMDPFLRGVCEALVLPQRALMDRYGRPIFCEKHPQGGRLIVRHRKKRPRCEWRVRCGAITRKGYACLGKPEPGHWRCRFHGGLSTGPKTPEGKAAIVESNRRRAEAKRAASL